MARKWIDNIIVENAEIEYPQFSGEKTPNNTDGKRGFNLIIRDPEKAQEFANDGWLIKHHDPRDGDNDEYDYLPVAIRFDKYPPNIYKVNPDMPEPVLLNEDGVSLLPEYTKAYLNIDVVISPSFWNVSGKSGIKAYVKTMYLRIVDGEYPAKPRKSASAYVDPFLNKYYSNGNDLPFDV